MSVQPVQDHDMEQVEVLNEDVVPSSEEDQAPMQKSGVRVDPDALMQTGKYFKRDVVHMSLIANGVRTKGTFAISKGRYNSAGAFYEYQLVDDKKQSYSSGTWIPENKLKLEKRG